MRFRSDSEPISRVLSFLTGTIVGRPLPLSGHAQPETLKQEKTWKRASEITPPSCVLPELSRSQHCSRGA